MTDSNIPMLPGWTARRVIGATLITAAIVAGFWLLYDHYIVLFIVFVGIVLGTAIKPPVDWLYGRGVPRPVGVIVVYFALLALLAGFVLLVAPLLTEQVGNLMARLPEVYRGIYDLLFRSRSSLLQRLVLYLPPQLALGSIGPPAEGAQLNDAAQVLRYVETLGTAFLAGLSILVLAFYWLLDGARAVRSLLLRVSPDKRGEIRDLIDEMEAKVGAYLIGQTIVCATIGLMSLVAYVAIGLPYALVLAVLAAVLEIVPVVGPLLGALPAGLLALSVAPEKFIWVVVAFVVIQQSENNLLIPRVMDRSVGVNPVVTILAIAAFASLFGVLGALLAVPLAAILQVLVNHLVLDRVQPENELPEGRDRVSILRYDAQHLVRDVRKQVRQGDGLPDSETDRVEDLIEAIATDLDSLLAEADAQEAAL